MCILPDATPGNAPSAHTPAAHLLPPAQRQHLALQALAGTRPIAQLAHDHNVSRKFVYQQAAKAEHALDNAFTMPDPDADRVLLPPNRAMATSRPGTMAMAIRTCKRRCWVRD